MSNNSAIDQLRKWLIMRIFSLVKLKIETASIATTPSTLQCLHARNEAQANILLLLVHVDCN